MSFLVLPPEMNSAAMYSGAGSGPMLEAAAAWDGLASELGSAAASFNAVTSGLVGQAWQGAAAQAMTAAAAPYTGWLSAAAAHASDAAGQARAVVSAFESAFAATVHPMSVAANRNSFVHAVMSNWFGLNAPAIAEFEAEYETMWARDVAAMVGYHGGAAAAAQTITTLEVDEAILSTPFNFGFPNIGFFNTGFFNTGFFNVGIGNYGLANVGIGNVGNNNIGEFLTGNGQIGIGSMNTGSAAAASAALVHPAAAVHQAAAQTITTLEVDEAILSTPFNFGFPNIGFFNTGFFNVGDFNVGIGNYGLANVGIGNVGNNNIGEFLTGNGQIGIGPMSTTSM